jgi:two-component system chemotaxis response regulator CheB
MIRVLVVDDSAFMRKSICDVLSSAPDIAVVATARDGIEALEKVQEHRPDVVTLDVEMPKLEGLHVLGYIMSECPTPVLMLSAHTDKGAPKTIQALEYGAVDFVTKPAGPSGLNAEKIAEELIAKIRLAAQVDVARLRFLEYDRLAKPPGKPELGGQAQQIVVIGSSTGGPRAIYEIVPHFPSGLQAGVILVQHFSAGFTHSWAERLNTVSALPVSLAENGQAVAPGRIYVAPHDRHLELHGHRGRAQFGLADGPKRQSVRPAVDATLETAARAFGALCTAVILTGMGRDGTDGAREVAKAGGEVLIQDEASSVVYGMPGSVVRAGIPHTVVLLEAMGSAIVKTVERKQKHNWQ